MMPDLDRRDQFLVAMYNQLMNDINRHIIVIWQSIGTLIAAIAAFTLVRDNVIPLDIACSIVLITCVWLIAHVYDASYWYNRNLVMIANIERQFLRRTDLREIHYYFGKHRPEGAMISHLRIQRGLALAIATLVLIFHFLKVILPIWQSSVKFDVLNTAPWIIAIGGIVIWIQSIISNRTKYSEFLRNSPGADIDTSGIEYHSGHGFG
jgi:hypothetical protein